MSEQDVELIKVLAPLAIELLKAVEPLLQGLGASLANQIHNITSKEHA